MANVAVAVTQSLAQHAYRLLGLAELNALIVVEDPNGNRLWTASGRLRNEFLQEGRLEFRKFAMEELILENMPSGDVVKGLNPKPNDANGLEIQQHCVHCKGDHSPLNCPNLEVCPGCGVMGHAIGECPQILAANPVPSAPISSFPLGISGSSAHAAPQRPICIKCNQLGHRANTCPNCPICKQGDHQVANCPAVAKVAKTAGNTKRIVCFNCKKSGHAAGECPDVVCRKCGEKGHMIRECPNPSKIVCHACGEPGHKSPNCPKAKVVCHTCGEAGHKAPKCPRKGDSNLGHDGPKVTRTPEKGGAGEAANDDDDDIVVLDETPAPKGLQSKPILLENEVSAGR